MCTGVGVCRSNDAPKKAFQPPYPTPHTTNAPVAAARRARPSPPSPSSLPPPPPVLAAAAVVVAAPPSLLLLPVNGAWLGVESHTSDFDKQPIPSIDQSIACMHACMHRHRWLAVLVGSNPMHGGETGALMGLSIHAPHPTQSMKHMPHASAVPIAYLTHSGWGDPSKGGRAAAAAWACLPVCKCVCARGSDGSIEWWVRSVIGA